MTELAKTKDRRAAIVDIAAQLFAEEGYAAASMSMIAARVGGSKATLYNYFKSKEAIFAAHIQTQCARVQEAMFDVDEDRADIAANLRLIGAHFVELILNDTQVANFRNLIAEAQRSPEVGRAFYEAGPLEGEGRLARHLIAAVARGELAPLDAAVASRQFLALCRSRFWMERLLGLRPALIPEEAAACAAEATEAFMRMYGKR